MNRLCIAIPTYNRSQLVLEQIGRLLPQLVPGVHLHIFDNASTDDTASRVRALEHSSVRLTTSPFNAGMARNICKALEEADAEWVWVLGDDDPVTPDAVTSALQMCTDAGSGVIEFDSLGGLIVEDRAISSLPDFFEHHDLIKTLFISSHLFHKASVSSFFGVLAPSCFTFGPHTALIVRMLEAGFAPFWLRSKTLLLPNYGVKGWSTLEVALGLSLLPEFIKSSVSQSVAAKRLLLDTAWMHCFGVREVIDRSSASRWKRLTRQSLSNLRSYRSGCLPLGGGPRRATRRELKDFLIVRVGLILPLNVLVAMGKRLRERYSHDRKVEVKDFA